MGPLLFTVTDVFQIRDRGCVLAPGGSTEPGAPNFRAGSAIRLVLPDGMQRDTTIRGLEMINFRRRPPVITASILLPSDIKKEDVPIGTKVYLISSADQ